MEGGVEFRIIYQNRFPTQQRRQDGTWGCRGCGGVIPKGRQTWCSKSCHDAYHPAMVIAAARLRDKEVCSGCGYDAASATREWWAEQAEIDKLFRYRSPAWTPTTPEPDNREYRRRFKEWQGKGRPRKIEYDHVIPFSEGGLTILENIRSLCEVCHRQRTRDWHAGRRKSQRTVRLELEFA
jgi:5-methylcytosine-specific restriction endonuclease McrA